jgi:hypothetical protein
LVEEVAFFSIGLGKPITPFHIGLICIALVVFPLHRSKNLQIMPHFNPSPADQFCMK